MPAEGKIRATFRRKTISARRDIRPRPECRNRNGLAPLATVRLTDLRVPPRPLIDDEFREEQ